MTAIGRPEVGEYNPYFERYVSLVNGADIVAALAGQPASFRKALGAVPQARAGFRYAEGKWSIREVVGHVIDAERVFGYRALGFARGEKAQLPGFDENEYAHNSAHDEIPLAELLDEFESVRKGHVLFFRHLTQDAWLRIGVANSNPISVRALAFVMAGHAEHHLAILRDRYAVPLGT